MSANGNWITVVAAATLTLTSAGCVTAAPGSNSLTSRQETAAADSDDILGRMLSGRSAVEGEELEQLIANASAYPLGSKENPVRAQGPAGQRAYLSRLRCADLKRPRYYRIGSAGMSPFGNIVDIYSVTCVDSEPAESEIWMDMYHRGHIEDAAVPGFGIVGGREAR